MSNVTLSCHHCGVEFEKAKKEHDRQVRKNAEARFYCSRSCVGHENFKNIPEDWKHSDENKAHIASMAAIAGLKYRPEEKPFAEHLRRAKARKKDFDLTIDYLRDLWNRQRGRCALSNIPMKQIGETTDINVLASLDRKDSSKGYVPGNVQFVVCALNYAKSDRGDVTALITLILEHNRA